MISRLIFLRIIIPKFMTEPNYRKTSFLKIVINIKTNWRKLLNWESLFERGCCSPLKNSLKPWHNQLWNCLESRPKFVQCLVSKVLGNIVYIYSRLYEAKVVYIYIFNFINHALLSQCCQRRLFCWKRSLCFQPYSMKSEVSLKCCS